MGKRVFWRVLWRVLLFVLLGAALLIVLLGAFDSASSMAAEESSEALERALRRATVECYAVEGRYPPSVSYLEENYGVQIDWSRFFVHYEGFASNLRPDITVVPLQP